MAATFIVRGASNDLERDAAFAVELIHYGAADCVLVCGRVANLLRGPVNVDFVGWKSKII